ncbi:MAG: ExeA family protein [Candidatus Methylomirabilales bacterium]
MYEEYWGLSRAPFQTVPDPDFFCLFPAYQEALERLFYVVEYGKGAAMLTGEIGAGKTTLSRVFLLRLDEERYDVGLVINPALRRDELLYEIALQLGTPPPKDARISIFRAINERLLANAQQERGTVLIIDEAQTITQKAALEDLRMLLNFQFSDRHLLSIILFGQPDLRETLARQRALDQRIAIRLHLGPLGVVETVSYIEFRLEKAGATRPIFTDEAINIIHRAAWGIPRSINHLCDLCLFEGMHRKVTEIDASLAKAVRGESETSRRKYRAGLLI